MVNGRRCYSLYVIREFCPFELWAKFSTSTFSTIWPFDEFSNSLIVQKGLFPMLLWTLSTRSTHKIYISNICGIWCWQIPLVWQNESIFVVLVALSRWSGINGTAHNDAEQFTRILKSPSFVSLRNLGSSRVEDPRHVTQMAELWLSKTSTERRALR